MPQTDPVQAQLDKDLEDDIANSIKQDIDPDEETPSDPKNTDSDSDSDEDVKNRKKTVDKNTKDDDTDTDEPDPQQMYDAVVQKVINQEFDGDESRLEEAKAIANVAVKTFNGDPIKAAKSYRNLFKDVSQQKQLITNNPFLEKLINEAKQGKTIDENYAKSLLGTATSADNPPTKPDSDPHKQLDDEDFDPDSITKDQLIEAGIITQQQYDNADPVDRKDMVEKARIKYSYRILPEKMAERAAKLSQKKKQEAELEDKKDKAISTNKKRLNSGVEKVVTKYDVDFEGNPVHAQLWDEIKQKAYKIPDLEDDSNMLIADDAIERATRHVFQKHGVPLESVAKDVDTDPENETTPHKVNRMQSGTTDAMMRILSDVEGFQGVASKKKSKGEPEDTDNTVSSRVNQKVNETLSRGRTTAHMISGARKTDRKKPQ